MQYNPGNSDIVIQALGLNYSPNHLTLEPGSMLEASNIEIKRNNVVEPMRGFKLYGNSFSSSLFRARQIMYYKNRVLRLGSDDDAGGAAVLEYDSNKNGLFYPIYDIESPDIDISGLNSLEIVDKQSVYLRLGQPDKSVRTKYIEKNSNLYFTTSSGVRKLSVKEEADFDKLDTKKIIEYTGAPQVDDPQIEVVYTPGKSDGFLPLDSAVAYRLLWARKDNTNNLIRGVPSNKVTAYFSRQNAATLDFNHLLTRLSLLQTGTSLVNGKDDRGNLGLNLNPFDYYDGYSLLQNEAGPDIAQKVKDLAKAIGTSKPNTFVFLASIEDNAPNIHCYISKELVAAKGLNAGTIIRELGKLIDGNGGGQPFFASGKGKNVGGIKDALNNSITFLS